MKKIFLVLFVLLFPSFVNAEAPILLDDTADEYRYIPDNPGAIKNWNQFGQETDWLFGYGSRESSMVFGKITGGICKDNNSWLVLAFGRYPESLTKSLLHIDAVCEGKHVTGNLEYGYVLDPKQTYYDAASGKGEAIHVVLNGMLTIDGKNVEGTAEAKFNWKWKDDVPDMESEGNVTFSQMHHNIDLSDFIDLGKWQSKTVNWHTEKN